MYLFIWDWYPWNFSNLYWHINWYNHCSYISHMFTSQQYDRHIVEMWCVQLTCHMKNIWSCSKLPGLLVPKIFLPPFPYFVFLQLIEFMVYFDYSFWKLGWIIEENHVITWLPWQKEKQSSHLEMQVQRQNKRRERGKGRINITILKGRNKIIEHKY